MADLDPWETPGAHDPWEQPKPADPAPLINHLNNSPGMADAKSPLDAFQAGLQVSATGLALHGKANMQLPENAGFAMKLAEQLGSTLGDLPVTLPVAALTRSPAAAFAAPEAVRQTLMDYYDRGEVHTSGDFLRMMAHNAWEVGKAAIIGKVAGAGAKAGESVVGDITANGFAKTAGNIGGFTLGATDSQAVLQGRLPDAQDAITGAVIGLGFHVATTGAGRLTDAGKRTADNLKTIFRETGTTPIEAGQYAKIDPVLHDEIVQSDVNGKAVTPKFYAQRPPAAEPFVKTDAPDPVEHATELHGIIEETGHDELTPGLQRQYGVDPEMENLRRAFSEAGAREEDSLRAFQAGGETVRSVLNQGGNGKLPADAFATPEDVAKPILADLSKRYAGDSEAALVALRDGTDTASKYVASGHDPSMLPDTTQEYLKHVQDSYGIMGSWNRVDWTKFPTAKDTALRQFPDGSYKPKPDAIAGYLQDFGQRAGFRFVVRNARRDTGEMPPEFHNVPNGPQYVAKDIYSTTVNGKTYKKVVNGRRVEIPDEPDELSRRWYGLGRYEILHHEVGHALDHLVLNRGKDTTNKFTDEALRAELEGVSRQFRPKIWELNSQYTLKPSELMADGIATWMSRPDLRAQMPLFKGYFGKALEPYLNMANSALPMRSAGGTGDWTPPPGIPPDDETHTGATPLPRSQVPSGGKPPPGPPNPPNSGPHEWDDSSLTTRLSRFRNRVGEQPTSKKPLRTGLEFELDGAKRFDQTLARKGMLDPTKDISTEDMFRMTYGSENRADHFFRFGPIDALTWKRTGAPSLADVADIIDKADLSKLGERVSGFSNREMFNTYVLSERSLDKAKQGIDVGLFEEGEAEANVRDLKPIFGEAKDKLQQFNNASLDYLRDSGVISQKQVNAMIALNPSYMSIRRIMGDDASFEQGRGKGRFFRVNNPLKKMEGSDRDITDPWAATVDNVRMMIKMADRNRAIGHVVGSRDAQAIWGLKRLGSEGATMAEPGSDTFKPYRFSPPEEEAVKPLGFRARSNTQFVFYKDGKPELWEAKDEDLARLIRGADTPGEMHMLGKIANMPAQMERAGIISDPGFAFGIPLKHQLTAWALGKDHPPPYITAIRGLFHVFGADDVYQNALAHGVLTGAITDLDQNILKTNAQDVLARTGVFEKTWNVARHPIQFAQMITETLTNASRIGDFERGMRRGQDPLKSAMRARTNYLDYSEGMVDAGVQRWSRYIPFFRAGMLGLKQGWEAASTRPAQTIMYSALGLLMPQVMLYAANMAADENLPEELKYKNLPSQDRDLYFITPPLGPNGYRIRLPRPFVIGPALGVPMERILEHTFENNPHAFDGMLKEMGNDMIPSVIPAIAKPVLEQISNYNFFTGQPLISDRLRGASSDLQYTDATTEPAKMISRALGDHKGVGIVNVPPIILDNYAREWGGTMGAVVMRALGSLMKPESPDDWMETPFVKSFLLRHPGMNAAAVDTFYKDAQQFEQAHQDKVLEVQRGLIADARTDAAKSRVIFLERYKHTLNLMREAVNRTNGNETMTVDEKRQLTDQLVNEAIAYAQLGSHVLKTNSYDPEVAQVLGQSIQSDLRKALVPPQ